MSPTTAMLATVRRFFIFPVIALFSTVAAGRAHAQLNDDELLTARSEGMGSAFRALAFDNSAIDFNPAGLAQFPRVSFDIDYRLDANNDGSRFSVSMVDSLSSPVAGGVAYSFETAHVPDSGSKARAHRVITGFGFPLAQKRFFFGFNTRYIRLDYPDNSELKDLKAFTADAGILVRPIQYVALGATVNNIVDADRPELPLNAGGGVAVLLPRPGGGAPLAMAAGDVHADFGSTDQTRWGWSSGAQVAITPQIWLRGGYQVTAVEQNRQAAAGLSYVDEKWSIDYSIQIPVDGRGRKTRHIIGINLLVF